MVDAVDYLLERVRPAVVAEIVDVAHNLGSPSAHAVNRGHFSIPREVFCCVDHLGQIAFAKGKDSKKAVDFIERYFREDYRELAGVIYAMWRHGVVHAFEPHSYTARLGVPPQDVQVAWSSSNHARHEERRHHLRPYLAEDAPGSVHIVMNTCQLAEDLLCALDNFISCLRADPQYAEECGNRLDAIRSKKLPGDAKASAERAWARRGGLLSSDRNVLKNHPEVLP